MVQLVEFVLEGSNDTILVEVNGPEPDGFRPVGVNPVDRAQKTFEAAFEKLRPAASAIIQRVRGLVDPPDEIEVEFGLKLSAEAGVVVASTSVDANYTVTLKWKGQTPAKEH